MNVVTEYYDGFRMLQTLRSCLTQSLFIRVETPDGNIILATGLPESSDHGDNGVVAI